ncbi:hypothetical protein EJB05_04870 [Eragrostis curvula]|uniref:CHCH domain-containing protein n=1 Tax=Eragrostis curvula TaxID=38414 RepID=A0A5J9WBK6_9POAL|nr:hypothetical protein EJB05_04870 [Eragrostis curvula]
MSRRGSGSSEPHVAPQPVDQASIESSDSSMFRGSVSIIGSAMEKRAGRPIMKSADPCLIHSEEFVACVNDFNIPFEKCEDYLYKLFECRERT